MGSYKDKLSYEERWQVIHYIRGLQATEKGLEYGPEVNTFNPAFGTPNSEYDPMAARNGGERAPADEEVQLSADEEQMIEDVMDHSERTIINK